MREDLKEGEERVNHAHANTHTHLICHVLKVCVTNSLWVSVFEGQRREEDLEVSQKCKACGEWRISRSKVVL